MTKLTSFYRLKLILRCYERYWVQKSCHLDWETPQGYVEMCLPMKEGGTVLRVLKRRSIADWLESFSACRISVAVLLEPIDEFLFLHRICKQRVRMEVDNWRLLCIWALSAGEERKRHAVGACTDLWPCPFISAVRWWAATCLETATSSGITGKFLRYPWRLLLRGASYICGLQNSDFYPLV